MFLLLCTAVLRITGEFTVTEEMNIQQYEICIEVAAEAHAWGIEPSLAVAIAYEESRFHVDRVSRAGARGPMQVIPKWWCPNRSAEDCDFLFAGMKALDYYTFRYDLPDALARYNGGRYRRTSPSYHYARRVMRLQKKLELFQEADSRLQDMVLDMLPTPEPLPPSAQE